MVALILHCRRVLLLSCHKFSFPAPSISVHNVNYSTTPRSLDKTLNKLFNERDLDKLVDGFKHASQRFRFRCRHKIYDFTVLRLSAAGRFDAIESILEYQKRFTADFTREGFGVRIISLYGKARMASHALNTFKQLSSLGSPCSVVSFNAVLDALATAGDFPCLSATFHDVPTGDTSITPNLISYNILIKALCDKGELDAALDSLVLMEKSGIAPSLISFNILLKGFYDSKKLSEAEDIWNRMAKEGIQPDTRSFNAKMRGLISVGKTLEAVEILNKVNQSGLKLNIYSFNALIKGHCQDGNLEQAKILYKDLKKHECYPNRETFMLLIPRLSEAGELDLALKLAKKSLSLRCSPDSDILQVVVDGLVKNSKVEDAEKLVERSQAKGVSGVCIRTPMSPLAA